MPKTEIRSTEKTDVDLRKKREISEREIELNVKLFQILSNKQAQLQETIKQLQDQISPGWRLTAAGKSNAERLLDACRENEILDVIEVNKKKLELISNILTDHFILQRVTTAEDKAKVIHHVPGISLLLINLDRLMVMRAINTHTGVKGWRLFRCGKRSLFFTDTHNCLASAVKIAEEIHSVRTTKPDRA